MIIMWEDLDLFGKIFTVIVFTVLFGLIAYWVDKYEMQQEVNMITAYNKGYCAECQAQGSSVRLTLASSYHIGNGADTHYIYECPECGHTVETTKLMK